MVPFLHQALKAKQAELNSNTPKYISIIVCSSQSRCKEIYDLISHLLTAFKGVLEASLLLEVTAETLLSLYGGADPEESERIETDIIVTTPLALK
jgi:hypothetical protein